MCESPVPQGSILRYQQKVGALTRDETVEVNIAAQVAEVEHEAVVHEVRAEPDDVQDQRYPADRRCAEQVGNSTFRTLGVRRYGLGQYVAV